MWVSKDEIVISLQDGSLYLSNISGEKVESKLIYSQKYNPIRDMKRVDKSHVVIAQESGHVLLVDFTALSSEPVVVASGLRQSCLCLDFNQELCLLACCFENSLMVFTVTP